METESHLTLGRAGSVKRNKRSHPSIHKSNLGQMHLALTRKLITICLHSQFVMPGQRY